MGTELHHFRLSQPGQTAREYEFVSVKSADTLLSDSSPKLAKKHGRQLVSARHFVIENFATDDQTMMPAEDLDEFIEKELYLAKRYPEVGCMEFYRDLFPEGSLRSRDYKDTGKGNAVITVRAADGTHKRFVVFDDLEYIRKGFDANFAIVAPCSFFGRQPDGLHLHEIFGFAIDVDYVHLGQLKNIFFQVKNNVIPEPTYVVNSGHGVHVYYLLDEPLPVFKGMKSRFNDFKYALTARVANQYNSAFMEETMKKTSDMLWVGQGMRIVGGMTKFADDYGLKKDDYRIKAYRTGEKVSLNYLNQFVAEEWRLEDLYFEPEKLVPLDEAKERWPEWYERKIERKQKSPRWQWSVSRSVYDWWKKRIATEAVVGTRYFCMMCLAIYARKCCISEDELRRDALIFQKSFNTLSDENPFTVTDMEVALRGYRETYNTFPIKDIAKLTRISIKRNVRNNRDQWTHLQAKNWIADGKIKVNVCKSNRELNPGGRPKGVKDSRPRKRYESKKRDAIIAYHAEHPDANHSQIARVLGISRPTVIKWLRIDSQDDSQSQK